MLSSDLQGEPQSSTRTLFFELEVRNAVRVQGGHHSAENLAQRFHQLCLANSLSYLSTEPPKSCFFFSFVFIFEMFFSKNSTAVLKFFNLTLFLKS